MLQDLITAQKVNFKDHTELRAQMNTTKRVTLLSGNMVSNSRSEVGGVSARVYKGGTFGFSSSAEYSGQSVKNVLTAATENARFMDKHVGLRQGPLPSVTGNAVITPPVDTTAGELSQDALIDFANTLDGIITKKYKKLSARTVVADFLGMEKLLVVSDGTDSHWYQPRSSIYVFMTVETDDSVPLELFEAFSHLGSFDKIFPDPNLLIPKLDELYESLMKKREGVYAKAGVCKCVMHPDLAGILAHEAVGHTVEADIVLGGSVAAENLNKQVASELITMVDFAHTFNGKPCPLPVYVDDEGVPAEDAVLIDKGILKGYMHSRETARYFNMKPQGNARGFSFNDEPIIRMRNTVIVPGKDKLDDMIASIDDGYFLVKTGNGQADTTGEFMFSIELGYEIKNGKLGKAIRETTISGVAFDMLKTVDMVSDDMEWSISGFCGKKQPMTTGMGGPAVRCDINIGGR